MSSSVTTQKGLVVLVSFATLSWIVLTISRNSTKAWSTVKLHFSSPQWETLVRPSVPTAPGSPVRSPTETELRIKGLVERLDRLFPPRPFSHLNATTSAAQSRATILNPRGTHCRGEQLHVLLEARDHLGRRKEYGGDFLRARLASPGLKAGAAGRVTDLQNGSYLVSFSLPWQGRAWLSVRLVHPSEGASALWRARNRGYDKITFQGQFVNGSRHVFTECGLRLNSTAELCEYLEARDQEAFYCVKPPHFPCDAFANMFTKNHMSYLTVQEQSLFQRSNVGVEMINGLKYVDVSRCNQTEETQKERCRTGMQVPVPGGYTLQGKWTPSFCSQTQFDVAKATACLKGKLVYLLGDSTLRQWIYYFPKLVKTLKLLGLHGSGILQHHLLTDAENNIQIHWKRHTYPFVTLHLYSVIDVAYIPREIDRIPGDKDTVVAITLGLHFRAFPVEVFIRRVLGVRKAIERLFLRSPDTKVILKTENTREMHTDSERLGNFHGHVHLLILKDVFKDLNVGLIDAWDMSIAYDTNNLHPHNTVVGNQINLFLNYIC
ncbi:NXPE family member 1-like [Erinaceus europaeus]|uniref:NXPE family member 1-like n=1 Tax=Erinaceus europaeus TaxID=9365 RepID=A0ABM3WHG9_ERIEU|nr:NXPE family member 1-like [Erinaceus europaeus]XP_060036012.1 NXPE family member 1-like [Erinaceus europaeus]XP_060036013.1 NXPE family member 1-like [Erinaceus europaeus]